MSLLTKKLYYRKNGTTYSINRYSSLTDMAGKPYLCTKSTDGIGYSSLAISGNYLSNLKIRGGGVVNSVETAIVLPNIFVCGFQWENNYWAGDDLTPFTVPLGYTKLIFASNSTDGADIEGYETNWGNYVYRGRLVLLKNSTALEDVVNYTGTTNLTRQIFDVVAGDVISLDYRGTSGAAIELACVLSP